MGWLTGISVLYASVLFFVDACCSIGATFISAWITYSSENGISLLDYTKEHLLYTAAFILVWFWVALSFNLFKTNRRDELLFQVVSVFRAAMISLVSCGFAMIYLYPEGPEPVFLGYFGAFTLLLLIMERSVLCFGIWMMRRWGWNVRYIVIVGANNRSRHLVETLMRHSRFGYRIVGVLEDEPARLAILNEYRIPHLGHFKDLERVLAEHILDEVHICLPVRSYYETIQSMAHFTVSVGVSVRLVADLFPLRLATSRLLRIDDIPMLSLSTVSESTIQLALKRLLDLMVSSVLLVCCTIPFLVIGILIKMDSPGSMFFTQERVGLNQRRFRIIKFRSMGYDAEQRKAALEEFNEADGPVFKIRNDPRVTRIGRILRKYSIDELPQLINVFFGEMSLVGPRPLPVSEVEKYSWDQRRRLSVKPGMTGLWQVSGRSDLPFKEWIELDLAYIDNWTIFRDISILMRTFRVVIQGRGAV